MVPPFDIFRQEEGGSVIWIGVAMSLEEARQKIAEAMAKAPASYLIASLKTGKRQVIRPKRYESQ
ncbi:MAG: hypothetical protein ACRD51_06445 [Candidatus Acidiferrum sp.]